MVNARYFLGVVVTAPADSESRRQRGGNDSTHDAGAPDGHFRATNARILSAPQVMNNALHVVGGCHGMGIESDEKLPLCLGETKVQGSRDNSPLVLDDADTRVIEGERLDD